MPDSQFDNACTSGLMASSITGTLFDLTPSCAFVTAGQSLSFSLAFINVTSGTCNSGMCNDGSRCFGDFMCQPALNVSMSSDDKYGPGTDTVRGIPDGYDLVFKTFVR